MNHIDKELDRDYTYIGVLAVIAAIIMAVATKYEHVRQVFANKPQTEKTR